MLWPSLRPLPTAVSMQGMRQPQLTNRSRYLLQQSLRYHKSSRQRQSGAVMESFFCAEPLRRPRQPSSFQTLFQRSYANAAQDTFAAYRSSRGVMWTIIGLNTAVFGAWQYSIAQRDQQLVNKLQKNFTISLQGIKEGRYSTLLTSAISQQWLPHFFFNMFTFHTFGTILSVMGVGGLQLANLCIGSALAGSFGYLYHSSSQSSNKSMSNRSALGASGMVMGVGTAAACLAPFAPMQLMFIPINIPLWVIAVGYAAVDTYYLNANSPIGHSAHLGGSVFGVVYYLTNLRRYGGISRMLRGGRGR